LPHPICDSPDAEPLKVAERLLIVLVTGVGVFGVLASKSKIASALALCTPDNNNAKEIAKSEAIREIDIAFKV
jgi:hypothetical protein